MNNLIVLPMVIPVFTGIILVFLRPYIKMQRWLSVLSMMLTGGMSVYLLQQIQAHGILSLAFGDWPPPYGIVFVADPFTMLLVLTTSFVTLVCQLYAFSAIVHAYELMFFYPFKLFLTPWVNGAFLPRHFFILFFCFEVMLIASYILGMLGGRKVRLQ